MYMLIYMGRFYARSKFLRKIFPYNSNLQTIIRDGFTQDLWPHVKSPQLNKQIYCGLTILLHPWHPHKRPSTSRKIMPLILVQATVGTRFTWHKPPQYKLLLLTLVTFDLLHGLTPYPWCTYVTFDFTTKLIALTSCPWQDRGKRYDIVGYLKN